MNQLLTSQRPTALAVCPHEEPLTRQPGPCLRTSTDANPRSAVAALCKQLRERNLREFLEQVLAEPDVRRVLAQTGTSRNGLPCPCHQLLQQVATQVRYRCERAGIAGDVSYVATVIAGIGYLLAPTLDQSASADDVLRTLARDALRQLDAHKPVLAQQLRHYLDWGHREDSDGDATEQVCRAIEQAIATLAYVPVGVGRGLSRNAPHSNR